MLTHFSISQCGERHIEKSLPCQDFSYSCRIYSETLKHDIVIAAIADGVGSCSFSQDGSKKAVSSCVDFIANVLKSKKNKIKRDEYQGFPFLKLIKLAFEHALSQVEKLAEDMELPFMEFDSTLTTAIYDGESLWYGHIGDDGIVVLYCDGTYEMITTRHKGEEAHSVFPLKNEDLWEFGKSTKNVASFALMTDGVLDYCVDSKAMNSRVYFPFLEPALTTVMKNDDESYIQKKEWENYFLGSEEYQDKFRTHVTDDISFVIVQNAKLVKKLPEIIFDFEKWEADTQKRKKEIEETLFADFRKYKSQIQPESIVEKPSIPDSTPQKTVGNNNVNNSSSAQTVSSQSEPVSTQPVGENDPDTSLIEALADTIGDAVTIANKVGKKIRKQINEIGNSQAKKTGDVKKVEQSPGKKD